MNKKVIILFVCLFVLSYSVNALEWSNANVPVIIGNPSPFTYTGTEVRLNNTFTSLNVSNTLFTTIGGVGINTTSPQASLHISGKGKMLYLGDTTSNDAYASLNERGFIGLQASSGTVIQSTSTRPIILAQGDTWGTYNTRMYINLQGQVGIGTATPLRLLDVRGNVSLNNTLYEKNSLIGIGTEEPSALLSLYNLSAIGGKPYINISTKGVAKPLLLMDGSGAISLGTSILTMSGNPYIIPDSTDGADDNRLGFGGGGALSNTRGAYILVHGNEYSGSGGAFWFSSGNVAGSYLEFRPRGVTTYATRLDYNGNLGIGVGATDSNFRLVVHNTSSMGSGGYLNISSAGVPIPHIIVDGAGRVGIGTASPSEKLTVAGNWTGNDYYGELWTGGDIQVAVASAGVWYNVPMNETGHFNGVVLNPTLGIMNVTREGLYDIQYSLSISTENVNNNIHAIISLGETNQQKCEAHRFVGTGGDTGNMGGLCYLRLTANQGLRLRVVNDDDGDDIFIEDANWNIKRIGD